MDNNEAWKQLFKKHNILDEIKQKGFFEITAEKIKIFREPRLMAKWDTYESLPEIFKQNNINILPISRGSYILGKFELFETLPKLPKDISYIKKVRLPKYATIDINNITSEANAINVLLLSNIIDDFLNADTDDHYVSTFNGRMGTNKFEFYVNRYEAEPFKVTVDRAQCEIDAGLENSQYVVIIEAKNIPIKNFNIRQLYYPYRLWKSKVTNKPIRLVFCIYLNQIYHLLEYEFTNLDNYSSIKLVQQQSYSL